MDSSVVCTPAAGYPVRMEPLPPGQAGISFRYAWMTGDVAGMEAALPLLDAAHRVELVLGAALRDGRGGFEAARALGAGVPEQEVLSRLIGEPDTALDEAASAWIAAGVVPAAWRAEGAPVPERVAGAPPGMERVARSYAAGVGGLAWVDALRDRPLHAAVSRYYRSSTLFVLGPRPLLILAAV